MKSSLLSALALLWVSLAVVAAVDTSTCNFDSIVAKCGDIHLESIDDSVYGQRTLSQYENIVMKGVRRYNQKLQAGVALEGSDNPDVAIAYAFMHYVCFEPLIVPGEETKVYNCIRELCPRADNIESTCEGMNS